MIKYNLILNFILIFTAIYLILWKFDSCCKKTWLYFKKHIFKKILQVTIRKDFRERWFHLTNDIFENLWVAREYSLRIGWKKLEERDI